MYVYVPFMEGPVYGGDIKIVYPDWEEGQDLPEDFAPAVLDDRPELGENQIFLGLKPYLDKDGIYHISYIVHTLTKEEIEIQNKKIEKQRINHKLMVEKQALTEEEVQFLAENMFL